MANTYIQIGSTVTVGAGTSATIEFTSIPSTYTDLVLKLSGRTSESYNYASYTINLNGSATGFTGKDVYGIGTNPGSANRTVTYYNLNGAPSTANTFSNIEMYFPNYAGSTNKSFSMDAVSEENGSLNNASLIAGLWSNTAAINRITLTGTNNFVQYSTASLYGIKKN
jgi:hypothetical protein